MSALFTIGNPKTVKGEKLGILTAVLHLAPAETAGLKTVCPWATDGCKTACLNTAGRGGILAHGATTNIIQEARKRKTRALFADRDAFLRDANRELGSLRKRARRHGLKLVVRANGTSDLLWLARSLAKSNPDLTFYDYTKAPVMALLGKDWVHYTVSRSERSTDDDVRGAVALGFNVAVVFSTRRGQALPTSYLNLPVFDGDTSDYRPADPRGVIVGLRAKGKARKDTSGFVVQVGGEA